MSQNMPEVFTRRYRAEDTVLIFPVSRPAWAEIDQNNVGPERRKGHSKFCRSPAQVRATAGQIITARGFGRFAAQRPPCGKEASVG
jgi:hypothetical protein